MKLIRTLCAAILATIPSLDASATGLPPAPQPPLPVAGWTIQALGDSLTVQQMNFSDVSANGSGGTKSPMQPLTWVEAALRGVQFDMTNAPSVPGGTAGQVIGLKQLRGYAGTGCTAATATVAGANGFSASGIISKGSIVGWTVTSPWTSGVVQTTYKAVAITSDCAGTVVATPVLGNFGVFGASGQTLLEIRERAADICNGTYGTKPNVVVVFGASNDMIPGGALGPWTGNVLNLTGVTLANRMMDIVRDLRACSIFPIVVSNPVQSAAGLISAGYNSTQAPIVKLTQADYRAAMRRAANGDANLNPSNVHFLFVDSFLPYYVDNSTSAGDPISYLDQDGIHWNQRGAIRVGYSIAQAILPLIKSVGFSSPIPYSDTFDPTYNPTGNFQPVWAGTPATATGLMTGTIPNGLLNTNSGGTAPAAGSITALTTVGTVASPDSEGLLTPSVLLTFNVSAVAGTGSANAVTVSLRKTVTVPAGIAIGDYLEAACDVEYASLNNVISFYPEIVDQPNNVSYFGPSSITYYSAFGFDPLVGSAGPTGWFGWPLRLHTAPLRVRSNTSSVYWYFSVVIDASASPASLAFGGVAGVTGNIRVRNCTVQDYHPTLN